MMNCCALAATMPRYGGTNRADFPQLPLLLNQLYCRLGRKFQRLSSFFPSYEAMVRLQPLPEYEVCARKRLDAARKSPLNVLFHAIHSSKKRFDNAPPGGTKDAETAGIHSSTEVDMTIMVGIGSPRGTICFVENGGTATCLRRY